MPVTTEEVKLTEGLLKFVHEWKDKPGNLIMILHKAQEEYGYIPRPVAIQLSKEMDVPLAKIYGVITFYHFFKLKKPGKNKISVCMGTACYLKGGEDLIQEMENLLGIGVNAVTEDGLFSIEAVRCVGCCGLAPVLTVNNEVYGKVKKEQLAEIIAKHREAQVHYSLCDFIADIVQNALEAGSRFTCIKILQDARNLAVTITDTGKGMTGEELLRARDPFTTDGKKHPGRKVGLGIPFLAQAAALTKGDFDIRSRPGEGTSVFFRFDLEHLDTPPLGSLPETFRQILTLPGDYEMEIKRKLNTESYKVLRSEIIEILEDLSTAASLNLLKTYLESLEDSLVTP